MSNTPTMARAFGGRVWHRLNRGATSHRTMCGRDASLMARFHPADLPSGERTAPMCAACRPTGHRISPESFTGSSPDHLPGTDETEA